jgi:hypothetical protein
MYRHANQLCGNPQCLNPVDIIPEDVDFSHDDSELEDETEGD